MAWTYSQDPSTSPLDQVRFLVGDTNAQDQQLQDAEILWTLGTGLVPVAAAIACCRALRAKFARQVTKTIGKTSVQATDRAKAYGDLADELARLLPVGGPLVGGIDRATNMAAWNDPSKVPPLFRIGQDEFPGNNSHHWTGYGAGGLVQNPDGSEGYGTNQTFDQGLSDPGADD